MINLEVTEQTYAPGRRVKVTCKFLRLRNSPGTITELNAGRGSAYAMVQLDREDYDEPMCFDLDQLRIIG